MMLCEKMAGQKNQQEHRLHPVDRKQDSQADAGIIGDAAQGRRLGLQG